MTVFVPLGFIEDIRFSRQQMLWMFLCVPTKNTKVRIVNRTFLC